MADDNDEADDAKDMKVALAVTDKLLAELEISVANTGIALMAELLKLLPPGTNTEQAPVGKCLLAYKSAIEARAGLLAARTMFSEAIAEAAKTVSSLLH
jgi:hypothetical protein